ncbi:MAG: PorT family protein, partial [Bdellovibrionaceae bacterium]|nr:PorT family protein [Pseudobdellovibrionaceae bacterium]
AEIKSGSSISFGAIGRFELSERLGLRTGMHYIPRQYEWEQGGQSNRLRMTYFELPATFLYYFTEGGGVFLGPSFSFNLDKDCGTLVCSGVSGNIVWMQFGASFKVAPQIGVEVFFEQSLGTPIKTHVTQPRAVGFNFFVTFD